MTSCNPKCNVHYASFWSNPPYLRTHITTALCNDFSGYKMQSVRFSLYTRCSLDQTLKSPERPDDVIILISKTESILHL